MIRWFTAAPIVQFSSMLNMLIKERKMTTMFVLTLATDYEGEVVLGVYSSEELAQSASNTFVMERGSLRRSEQFEVNEIVVDAPAKYHW
jgi:hypothetical protein